VGNTFWRAYFSRYADADGIIAGFANGDSLARRYEPRQCAGPSRNPHLYLNKTSGGGMAAAIKHPPRRALKGTLFVLHFVTGVCAFIVTDIGTLLRACDGGSAMCFFLPSRIYLAS